MVDWAQLYLFELIFMRMSGFLLFNPLLGRSNLPAMVKTGMALVLSILVFGTAGTGVPQPDTLVELAFRLLLELGIGLVLGFVMRVVFSVVQIGGEVIDTQMGMTMAQIYDASSQANLSVTASLLNILLILDFFAENGHYTLMRLLTTSGELVPYGATALGDGVYAYVIELFLACMLLAVKLAMPILAAELLGEVGMGVLMKAIPQINAFVINIELKVIIGLLLFFLLLTPINEFLLELESGMLSELGRILRLIGGA
ncbi:flagellar biosynthetic protein FliR [Flavonifractor plautii]|uniref:flagellar biosynthetic protein FliR n=1 Tax=Flavonifractor plautii TaxID=292800 RepID=UPI00214CD2C0|nr:flagellar biosynthetic protein FliR [Flavonifractor plautii]MCR1921290.1 flagellar biosynthetic protein FliR [Flavonifractor plautii]